MEPEDAKSTLRTALREARSHRSARRRAEAQDALGVIGSHLIKQRGDEVVALYAARPSEPSTADLMDRLSRAGVEVLLPLLGAGLARQWATFKGLDDLVERAPGRPPEPSGPALDMTEVSRASLILVPALAVDSAGCRLGQGGGWYDRVLTHVRPDATILAVVFQDEVFDDVEFTLPREPHDQLVHGAITPQEVITFTSVRK